MKRQFKGTPGEWVISFTEEDFGFWRIESAKRIITRIFGLNKEAKANAHAIKAVPDMIGVLSKVVDMPISQSEDPFTAAVELYAHIAVLQELAKLTLNKALGEEESDG